MLRPLGCKVLIKQDDFKEQNTFDFGSAGKFEIVSENERLERAAMTSGVIVDVGPAAWKAWREMDDQGREHNGRPWAKVGDRVLYAKFGGAFIIDPETKEEYILLNDEDLHCVVLEKEEE